MTCIFFLFLIIMNEKTIKRTGLKLIVQEG